MALKRAFCLVFSPEGLLVGFVVEDASVSLQLGAYTVVSQIPKVSVPYFTITPPAFITVIAFGAGHNVADG